MVSSEFGRTPKINKDAGRDHWPKVFSVVLAGGGIEGGLDLRGVERGRLGARARRTRTGRPGHDRLSSTGHHRRQGIDGAGQSADRNRRRRQGSQRIVGLIGCRRADWRGRACDLVALPWTSARSGWPETPLARSACREASRSKVFACCRYARWCRLPAPLRSGHCLAWPRLLAAVRCGPPARSSTGLFRTGGQRGTETRSAASRRPARRCAATVVL